MNSVESSLTIFDVHTFKAFLNELTFEEVVNVTLIPLSIVFAFFLVGMAVNSFIEKQIERHFNTDEASLKLILVSSLRGLPRTWCTCTGIYWTIKSMNMPLPITHLLSYIIFTMLILTITQVIARAISGFIEFHTQRNDNMPKTTLLTNITSVVVYAMGFVIILEYCGISVAPILTALGVGGMAVAFALQDTLSNMFSGLHLVLSPQIHIGDYIRISPTEEGRVTDISWRYTTIEAVLGNSIIVPNNKILTATLINFSSPSEDMIIKLPIGVSYDSDLDKVEAVTIEVAKAVTKEIDPSTTADPNVFFHTFGDSSIEFNVHLHISEISQKNKLQHEFIKALTKRYREEGIDIPFPIRTVYNQNVSREATVEIVAAAEK